MNGFILLRRGLIDHIRAGTLSPEELGIYIHLLFCADFSTGLQKNSAPHIYYSMGQRSTIRCIQRALENLEKLGFIKRFRIPGKKKDYHLLVDKYEVTCGVLTGSRVNAAATTDWCDIQYTLGTDTGTDCGTDPSTECALEQAGSDNNSKKNSQKKSVREVENMSAKAVAPPTAVAMAELSYPTTPQAQSLEFIHWLSNPERPDEDDVVRGANVDKILALEIPDPVKFGNIIVWAYRTSRYKEHLGDIDSFLKLLPKITKSYDKYYDQDEYRGTKLTPEEKINTLEKIEEFAAKLKKRETKS